MSKANKKMWEPEFKYESVHGTFTDYRGQKRDYVMVAVSIPDNGLILDGKDPNDMFVGSYEKILSVGVSVRCPRDKDCGIGERIAYGKAVKLKKNVLFASRSGMINTKMVQAFLEQEAAYFEKNPGSYLAGYNRDRERYELFGHVADAELTSDELNKTNVVDVDDMLNVKDRLLQETGS